MLFFEVLSCKSQYNNNREQFYETYFNDNDFFFKIPLQLNVPHELPLSRDPNSPTITVTLLFANHVPGSVMFVFSGFFGNVLYTADFRYSPKMLEHDCVVKMFWAILLIELFHNFSFGSFYEIRIHLLKLHKFYLNREVFLISDNTATYFTSIEIRQSFAIISTETL